MKTKHQIYTHLQQNPEHILCELTRDDFKLAREYWPLYTRHRITIEDEHINGSKELILDDWEFHLQQLILEPDQLKYLQGFLEGEE